MLTKILTVSCLVAMSLAAPAEEARDAKQLILPGAAGVYAAHIAPAVAPIAPALAPNCRIAYEDIETQICTPKALPVCETKEVIAQHVEYRKLCKDVTSKHCAGAPAHLVFKRDAEADPQFFGALGLPYHHGLPHTVAPAVVPAVAPAVAVAPAIAVAPAVVAHEETHTTPCHTVTAEHCVNNPEVVDTPVPIEQCHIVEKVDCVAKIEKIPKTLCEPVETKVVKHVISPFAYGGYGGYGIHG